MRPPAGNPRRSSTGTPLLRRCGSSSRRGPRVRPAVRAPELPASARAAVRAQREPVRAPPQERIQVRPRRVPRRRVSRGVAQTPTGQARRSLRFSPVPRPEPPERLRSLARFLRARRREERREPAEQAPLRVGAPPQLPHSSMTGLLRGWRQEAVAALPARRLRSPVGLLLLLLHRGRPALLRVRFLRLAVPPRRRFRGPGYRRAMLLLHLRFRSRRGRREGRCWRR